MAEPVIRRAHPCDAGALARVGEASFRETFLEGGFAIPYPADDLRTFLDGAYSPEAFAAILANDREATWIAEADGERVAFVSAGACTLPHPEAKDGDVELHRLYVLRGAQGRGLGRRLLETALDWMGRSEGAMQWIGVWSGNLKAQRLYAHYGFERVGGYSFPVGRWRDQEFILRRPPPQPSTLANTGARP